MSSSLCSANSTMLRPQKGNRGIIWILFVDVILCVILLIFWLFIHWNRITSHFCHSTKVLTWTQLAVSACIVVLYSSGPYLILDQQLRSEWLWFHYLGISWRKQMVVGYQLLCHGGHWHLHSNGHNTDMGWTSQQEYHSLYSLNIIVYPVVVW